MTDADLNEVELSWCESCQDWTPFNGTSVCPICGYDHTGEDRLCKFCNGSGWYWDMPCSHCDGEGIDPLYW